MRKLLFALVLLTVSGLSYAFDLTVRYCYSDLNGQCMLVTKDTAYIPPIITDKMDQTILNEFERAGYFIYPLTPEMENDYLVSHPNTPTVQKSSAATLEEVNEMGEDMILSGVECGGAVAGCVAATTAAVGEPWFGMLLVRIGCASTGAMCSRVLTKYYKWQKLKEEYQQDLKDNPPPKTEAEGEPAARPPLVSSTGSGMSLGALCHKYNCQDPLNHRGRVTWWEEPPPKIN